MDLYMDLNLKLRYERFKQRFYFSIYSWELITRNLWDFLGLELLSIGNHKILIQLLYIRGMMSQNIVYRHSRSATLLLLLVKLIHSFPIFSFMAFDVEFECLFDATDLKIALWRLCSNFTILFFYYIKIVDSGSRCNKSAQIWFIKTGPEKGQMFFSWKLMFWSPQQSSG